MADPRTFLVQFGAEIAEDETLIERILDRTYSEVEAYAGVPRDDLLEATRQTMAAGAASFREQRMVVRDDLAFDAEVVRRRVRQGVTPAGWFAHGRVFMEELCDAAARFGREHGFPEAETQAAIILMWAESQDLTAAANQHFEQAAREILEQDEDERRDYLAGLLRGTLTPARARAGAVAIGVDPDALYAAARIRPGDAELVRRLTRAGATVGARDAWALVDGEILGICRDRLPADVAPATAGLGPVTPLDGLGESYALATSALETAGRFGRVGAHRVEDLGALPLVNVGGRAAELLQERFVGRLAREGAAVLVDTVREYLACSLSPGTTARSLHLHPNSLRKRLARYEELTGADLRSIDDLVAIWWALRRQELEG